MDYIRLGNPIVVKWAFNQSDGTPAPIGQYQVELFFYTGRGKTRVTDTTVVTINENVLTWRFEPYAQPCTGAYSVLLKVYNGAKLIGSFDHKNIFALCSLGSISELPVEINISSTFDKIGGLETYSELPDKPKINGVTLVGDKSLAELGISSRKPYLSLERLGPYLYNVTFDKLPEDNGVNNTIPVGGCSSYVQNGKLYTNLDWDYSETAEFKIRTKDFEGTAFIQGLIDGELNDSLIAQLPYRVRDGINNNGIKMATHVLFNDWGWTGCGDKSISLTRLPFLVLSKVKSMVTIESDLAGVLDNLYAPQGLADMEYLLQIIVTDGTTTYVLMPPTSDNESYILQDISANAKLANFRWVSSAEVERTSLQDRPTGVERWNLMPCALSELRFTKAYEYPTRLSEFIGINDTDKDSTDEELEEIYEAAHAIYLERERDGQTWHTMHSVVYGVRMEQLYIQENWNVNFIAGIDV